MATAVEVPALAESTQTTASQLDAALSLLERRLSPVDIKNNLNSISVLASQLTSALHEHIHPPLEVRTDVAANKKYLVCDYNRKGESFRSPWSNEYDPHVATGEEVSDKHTPAMREMEVAANELLEVYAGLYYTPAGAAAATPHNVVTSAYFWNKAESSPKNADAKSVSAEDKASGTAEHVAQAFGSCWLIHKDVGDAHHSPTVGEHEKGHHASSTTTPPSAAGIGGSWDAIHVIEARQEPSLPSPSAATSGTSTSKWHYTLTSTLQLQLRSAHGVNVDASSSSLSSPATAAMAASFSSAPAARLTAAGSLTRTTSVTTTVTAEKGHVANIGPMIEAVETDWRASLESIYIAKSREIVAAMHSADIHAGTERDPTTAVGTAATRAAANAVGATVAAVAASRFGGVALPGLGAGMLRHHVVSTTNAESGHNSSNSSSSSVPPASSPPHRSGPSAALVGDLKSALAAKAGAAATRSMSSGSSGGDSKH